MRALPLFIDYGQRNKQQEFTSLERNAELGGFPRPIVMDVAGFGSVVRTGLTDPSKRVLEDAFTPNRNLLFLILAASVGHTRGVSTTVMGFLSEATAIFPDQTNSFLRAAKFAITESLGVEHEIILPLRDFTKSKVVELSKQLGVVSAYSCHVGGDQPCGKCIACLEYVEGG